jgi:hypothetical protein
VRAILTFATLLMVSAPMVARENLTSDEVSRFLATAEEAQADGLGALARGEPAHVLALEEDEAILARHGFSPAAWHRVATRVVAAHQALQLVLPRDGVQLERKLNQDRSLSGDERRTLVRMLTEQRRDMQDLAAETRADQTVVAPYRARLDAILIR